MTLIERATVIHYHRHRISRFGLGRVEALGWRDESSQRRRFEVIADALDFERRSVLDLGCGCGDLRAFLAARFDEVDYVGIDLVPEFIHHAAARYAGDPKVRFFLGDFGLGDLPRADIVVGSGALGYRCDDSAYHLRMIRRMVAAADHTVILNVLDAASFPADPLLVGRDIDDVLAFCATLSPCVRWVRGYLPGDVTIVMMMADEGNALG